jgi:hypothetical protein
MEGFLFRQRLTWVGWTGLALLICVPIASAFYIGAWLDASSYRKPEPMLGMVLFAAGIVAGVMVLIGRETYVVKAPGNDIYYLTPNAGTDLSRVKPMDRLRD